MNSDYICQNHNHLERRFLFPLIGWLIILGYEVPRPAQAATLNVTNYGAWGDVSNMVVSCTSNSYTFVTTNPLSATLAGKIISITGAGAWGTSGTSPTNFQDFVAQINSVNNSTNLVLNRPAGCTTNFTLAIYGTCSSTGIQAAINSAGVGDTVSIPVGRYLVIPPVWSTNWMSSNRFVEAAITISKGGIHILGDDRNNSVLIGNGAWQLTGFTNVYRGPMINLQGPFTNGYSSTLTFENLTMDGGVSSGRTSDQGFPARTSNGNGWDVTHDAVLILGQQDGSGLGIPFCTNNSFLNLNVIHWRGEMFKGTFPIRQWGDFYGITNCLFGDGNASAINIQQGGSIKQSTFTNLILVTEHWQANSTLPFNIGFNYITNCASAFTIDGADTNYLPQAAINITSNNIQADTWGINLTPTVNTFIQGNYFHDTPQALLLGGAGGQGYFPMSSNIVFIDNLCTNVEEVILGYAGECIYATNNISKGGLSFATGFTLPKVFCYGNWMVDGRDGMCLSAGSGGQYYYDDPSNNFPFHTYNDYGVHTNIISYGYGWRHFINDVRTNSIFALDDSFPSFIPAGAELLVTNGSGLTLPFLYLNRAAFGTPLVMTPNFSSKFKWTNGVWRASFKPAWNPNLQVIPLGQ